MRELGDGEPIADARRRNGTGSKEIKLRFSPYEGGARDCKQTKKEASGKLMVLIDVSKGWAFVEPEAGTAALKPCQLPQCREPLEPVD